MKIVIINPTNQGFFPRLYKGFKSIFEKQGHDCLLLSPRNFTNNRFPLPNQKFWGTYLNFHIHYRLYKLLGIQDVFSFFETLHLLRILKKEKPDIIHMHNAIAWVLNFPLFIRYVNKHNIPIVWTMHDCRAITGRCAHFEQVGCFEWKNGCHKCKYPNEYWPTILNNSGLQWKIRNKYFPKFKNLTIITPSHWLENYMKESPFFTNHNILTIHNGISTETFSKWSTHKHRIIEENKSKKIVLCVAVFMNKNKGLYDLIEVSKLLPNDYQIVLIGNISNADAKKIPSNIICLPRTSSIDDLVSIFQGATVYANPTHIDNFPTVNIEALAAGLPIATYNTGGSPEAIDETCGIVVEKGDINELTNAIIEICENRHIYTRENCQRRAKEFSLSQYEKYLELYHKLNKNK